MSDGEVGVGTFIGFLREKKRLWLIAAALTLGVCLMLFGTGGWTSLGDDELESLEERVKALCEQIDGVSDVYVMITSGTADNEVRGVAIVCSGGEISAIQLKLTNLLCALFEIPSSAVSVVGGK